MRHRLALAPSERLRGLAPQHCYYAVQVTGDLDLGKVAIAWRKLQERHAVLRTRFNLTDGYWLTVPCDYAGLTVGAVPPVADRGWWARADLGRVLLQPFDLAEGPLARMHVITVDSSTTVVGVAVDHIVSDGWSIAALVSELWHIYSTPEVPLADAGIDFASWVREENDWLQSPAGRRALSHCVEVLEPVGPLPEIRLPGFNDAPGERHDGRGRLDFTIDERTVRSLRATGHRLGLSMISLAHAALAGSCHALTGQTHIGTTIMMANRGGRAVRHTVGLFANNVVVLVELMTPPDAPAFLRQFSEAVASAVDRSRVPFGAVLDTMAPDQVGEISSMPWIGFNPASSAISSRFPEPRVPALELAEFGIDGGWQNKSVELNAFDDGATVAMALRYKAGWYSTATATLLRDCMLELLDSWAADASQ
jgi:myxalamid-type nonribosomal peptide synthetase MxaA